MPAYRSNSAATDSLIGQTIGGQYTLQRFLGQGSKARVFLATHRTLHRTVVVHLLNVPWGDDPAAVARFEEQSRALRGIEHPNIAAIIDFGREPGRVFVVSEFVEGKLLSAYVKQLGRLTLEGFVPIAAQILKGLGTTHSRGLVHRDLKPSNIVLVEEQGRANYVKILDLGLAQVLEGPPRDEDTPVVGTPDYLAPEQILNKPVDVRTDVYSLGVVFYQMLSGKLPFVGEGTSGARSVLYKHVNDKPIPLTEALPPGSNVPEGLIDLVHDCLAKNPDNRPADANEIVERMIDSVPAALFRLPIASAGRTPTGELARTPTGDHRVRAPTGDHRVRAPTGDHRVRAPTGDQRAFSPAPEPPRADALPQHDRALAAAVEASGLRPIPHVELNQGNPLPTPPPESRGSSAWILGLLALLLTSGLVYVYIQNQGTTPVAPPTKVPTPPPVAVDPLASELEAASKLESSGKLNEALAAYEGVLRKDPSQTTARERVDALKQKLTPPPKTDPTPATTAGETKTGDTAGTVADVAAGTTAGSKDPPSSEPVEFLVEASAKAEIFVDGVSKGKTPQKVSLPPGPHKFELKAPGFLPYEETIEVAADGQKSLKGKLVRKTGGTGGASGGGINRDEENAASNQLDPENDAPTTKVEVPLKPR